MAGGGRLIFGLDVSSLFLSTFLIVGLALAFCIKILLVIKHNIKKGKNANPWYPVLIVANVVDCEDLKNSLIEKDCDEFLALYQMSLNASILKREWTKEEDDQLRDDVETLGESNWHLVASVMEGRTGTHCYNRLRHTSNN